MYNVIIITYFHILYLLIKRQDEISSYLKFFIFTKLLYHHQQMAFELALE